MRNPQLQFLNGLAYERMSRSGDRSKLELARVGYENATRFDPGSYWAHLHLGYLELDAGNYVAAQESFAKAVQDQPGRWEASYGLGVASYYAGDAGLARLAAERLQQIDPQNPGTLRLLAFSMAMVGDPAALEDAQKLQAADPTDTISARRVAEVLRGTTLAQAVTDPASRACQRTGAAAAARRRQPGRANNSSSTSPSSSVRRSSPKAAASTCSTG